MDNRTLAVRLIDMAHDLEQKHASVFRIRAYRRAAETVLGLDRRVEEIFAEGGRRRLAELPSIGKKLSLQIEELLQEARSAPRAATPRAARKRPAVEHVKLCG